MWAAHMALNTELQRKGPKNSWWATKDRKVFNAGLEQRLEEGMIPVPTPTFGLLHNTATQVARQRKKKADRCLAAE